MTFAECAATSPMNEAETWRWCLIHAMVTHGYGHTPLNEEKIDALKELLGKQVSFMTDYVMGVPTK